MLKDGERGLCIAWQEILDLFHRLRDYQKSRSINIF